MKYFLCYHTPVGVRSDGSFVMRIGKQYVYPADDLDMALGVCDYMVLEYGAGTHWIEDEEGNRVERNEA